MTERVLVLPRDLESFNLIKIKLELVSTSTKVFECGGNRYGTY